MKLLLPLKQLPHLQWVVSTYAYVDGVWWFASEWQWVTEL